MRLRSLCVSGLVLLASTRAAAEAQLNVEIVHVTSQVASIDEKALAALLRAQLAAELAARGASPVAKGHIVVDVRVDRAQAPLGPLTDGVLVRIVFALRGPGGERRVAFAQKSPVVGALGAHTMVVALLNAAVDLMHPRAPQDGGGQSGLASAGDGGVLNAPPAGGPTVVAARATLPPRIDGRVDDDVWRLAPVFTDFVESWPSTGASPTQRTELRVLYDDRNLYVSFVCFDTEPELIGQQLGTRDSPPPSDLVEVAIDSAFDRRSAYYFSLNAAGVQTDGLVYGDVNFTTTWDAAWEGRAALRPDGWSAELQIPLGVLRFPNAPKQRWGFEARRTVSRTHQVFDSALIAPTGNAIVSAFGELGGVVDVRPRHFVEVTPYLAARAVLRPQFSDPASPQPRLFEPSGDIGIDLRTGLFSDLMLTATLNPDFGQVEADQLLLNLSNVELFFPEKRPFFNQGLDLFAPVGEEYGAPYRWFYSRRIGLDAPIFGAAKVAGTVTPGLAVGALDVVVLGPADPGKAAVAFAPDPAPADITASEAQPDRRYEFHPTRPLHLGPNFELPATRPTPTNFSAASVRADLTSGFNLGATFGASTPLAPRCTRADFATAEQYAQADCAGAGGELAGLEWNLRSESRDWVFLGALHGSHREGGPLNDLQPDGTAIHPGDFGYGGYFKAGKYGGEGFRVAVDGSWTSPRFDPNPIGFLPTQNLARAGLSVSLFRTTGIGSLHDLLLSVWADTSYTTDLRWTPRGNNFGLDFTFTLPGYQRLGLGGAFSMPMFDVRETQGLGIPFERRMVASAYLLAESDPSRAVYVRARATGSYALAGPVPAQFGYGADGVITLRPASLLETRVDAQWANAPEGARFVAPLPDADAAEPSLVHILFGRQESQNLSITLRQSIVMTPRLTLTGYAQFFTAFVHYPAYFTAAAPAGGRISLGQLSPTTTATSADFHEASLNISVVLRWEYRLGSMLFLVYTHSGSELALDQPPTTRLFPVLIGAGPAADTFMLKWSWHFAG